MASHGPASIDEALDWLRKHFDPDAARGLRVSYQFDLGGPGGGTLHARVDDGQLDVAAGTLAEADVHLRLAARDFFAVLAGRENADMLFMAGHLRIEGGLSLALKLRQLFHARA